MNNGNDAQDEVHDYYVANDGGDVEAHAPTAPATTTDYKNKYYEIDDVLDRRIRRFRSDPGREVVEYYVSWKGDEYPPSWHIAENLDQNSLASAFRKFPVPADPDRVNDDEHAAAAAALETQDDVGGDELGFDDELSDDEEDLPVDDDAASSAGDDDVPQDDEDDDEDDYQTNETSTDPTLQNEISHLGESDYDSPGTVELVLNKTCYRVGQSYFSENKKYVLTISTLLPKLRQSKCHRCIRVEDTFACPQGWEGTYAQMEDVIMDLEKLKVPCKHAVHKCPFKYNHDEERRAFCYFTERGKAHYHFPKSNPSSLDLFVGAGGMSLGMQKAGFEVKWAVDNDALAASTLQANTSHGGVKVFQEDVKTFLKKSTAGDPAYPTADEVDHIHASPPCKGFSRANRNGGKDDFKNNQQTLLFVRAVQHFRPMTATFENVPGLVLDDYKRYLQSLVVGLLRMSYQVRVTILNSCSYGDAQKRRRLILMAARRDCILPAPPMPTHGEGPNLLPLRTSRDAIEKLEEYVPMSSRTSGAINIKGVVIHNHICSSVKPKEGDDFVLEPCLPSRTILAKSRTHVHYKFGRFITVREAACLQSFPPTYQFFGSLSSQYSQVGNAVPVRLATAIARSVAVTHGL